MTQPVLVAGARTPIGKLLGSLSALSAPELAGGAIAAALGRAGITGDQVDAVIMGNVIQAGVGPNPARLAAARGGIPMSVPASTVNKLCLSGLRRRGGGTGAAALCGGGGQGDALIVRRAR